jgi:hypothetical protein
MSWPTDVNVIIIQVTQHRKSRKMPSANKSQNNDCFEALSRCHLAPSSGVMVNWQMVYQDRVGYWHVETGINTAQVQVIAPYTMRTFCICRMPWLPLSHSM